MHIIDAPPNISASIKDYHATIITGKVRHIEGTTLFDCTQEMYLYCKQTGTLRKVRPYEPYINIPVLIEIAP